MFCFLRDRYRYVVLVVGFICLSSISGNMLVYSYTTICGDPYKPQRETQLFVLSAGAILGVFPFNWLYNRYGAHYVLFGAGVASAVATFFIPAAIDGGFWLFAALRFVQGVTYSADFAATGMICSQWASLKQHALFLSLLTCFSPLSKAAVNGIGALLTNVDCNAEYYIFSALAVPAFALWFFLYDDHPKNLSLVSEVELEKINRGKTQEHINRVTSIPYEAILRSKVVWAVWINAFADLLAGILIQQYLPVYLNEALGYDKASTGFIGVVALVHIPIKVAFGYVNDKVTCIPERTKMIVSNSVAVGMVGVVFVLTWLLPEDASPAIRVVLVTSVYAWIATGGGGFYKCGSLSSRQYAHFVIAKVQISKATTLAIIPVLIKLLVPDKTSVVQWGRVYLLIGILCIVANVLFCFVATDEPQEFTKIGGSALPARFKVYPTSLVNERKLDYL